MLSHLDLSWRRIVCKLIALILTYLLVEVKYHASVLVYLVVSRVDRGSHLGLKNLMIWKLWVGETRICHAFQGWCGLVLVVVKLYHPPLLLLSKRLVAQ
jgi:hypothetical protein